MLCPIARALDRVGDRWTLLILRDLHAGPMRFLELQRGMPGLASNLLSTRLERMQADGLIGHEEGFYRLSDLGRRTDRVLWELALLGMELPPDPDLKPTGHLRLVAITMQSAMQKVVDPDLQLSAEMILDGESFSIHIDEGEVRVRYGAPAASEVVATSSYVPLMSAAAGEVELEEFRAHHVELEGEDDQKKMDFVHLMTRVMTEAFHRDGAP